MKKYINSFERPEYENAKQSKQTNNLTFTSPVAWRQRTARRKLSLKGVTTIVRLTGIHKNVSAYQTVNSKV